MLEDPDKLRESIAAELERLPNVSLRRLPFRGPARRLAIDLDEDATGKSAEQVQEALRNGSPRIWVYTEGASLRVATHTLREGEEKIVARRLLEELG